MKKLIIISLILAFAASIFAQEKINLSDDIPFDDSYRVGTLDNGMKYYIRHNKKPEKRAEFWLVTHAGAMQEAADQNGLAHFCEHMAFNGTKNFPDKAVLDYLQSIGMEFGPDINAWTSYNETVYTLTKVPVEDKAYIDTSMLILKDWASNVSYLDEEIKKERGVIHEEWRARNSSSSRIRDSINMKLYKGSKYAKHNVIGTLDVIDNAPEQRLRDFFNTWYRPDLQAIIAIGDIDVDETERKIREVFGSLENPDNPEPRVKQEIPDHDETLYAIHTDKEASNIQLRMYFKGDPLTPALTFEEYREEMLRNIAFRILRQRVEKRSQDEGKPMTYGAWGYYNIQPEKSALLFYAYPREGKILHSATILLEEMNRALQTGFTAAELEEAQKAMMRWAERSVREKETQESRGLSYSVVSAFKKDDVIMSPETVLAFYEQYLDGVDLEEVEEAIHGLMTENNRVISLSGPEDAELVGEAEIAEVIETAESKTYKAFEPLESIDELLAEAPKAGSVEKVEKIDEPECERWTLSNGMKVYVKFADFKEDEYAFLFYSEGGQSLYDLTQKAELAVAEGAVGGSGLADYEQIQLDRYMDGKKLYDFGGIRMYNESLMGMSMVKYLEDNFAMYHLMFTQPRLDKKGYESYMSGRETFYKNRLNNPDAVIRDSLVAIRYDNHPWGQPLEWEDYENIEYSQDLLKLYKERFSDADDFTMYLVGNFDRNKLKTAIETYIASIPSDENEETYKDVGRRMIHKPVEKTISIPMVTPKASVQLEYHNEMACNYENRVKMRAVANILDRRFTETVREDEGGTYGVNTYGYISYLPYEDYMYYIRFSCDPERVQELKAVIFDEINKIKNGEIDDHYVEEFKKAYAKKRSEDLKDNFSWMNMLSMYDQNGMYDYSPEMDALVEKISKADVRNFAGRIFKDDVKMEVTFLPEKAK